MYPSGSFADTLLIIGLGVFFLFGFIRAMIRGRRQRWREWRMHTGQCTHCGYDLRETPERCPECGLMPDPAVRAQAAMSRLLLILEAVGKNSTGLIGEAPRICDTILRDSADATHLNHVAWLLVAIKDSPFHDPVRALQLAKRACELTDFDKASCLDTLAVCHAARNQFDEAIRYVEMAIQRCVGAEHAGCQKRLEMFRAGQLYLE